MATKKKPAAKKKAPPPQPKPTAARAVRTAPPAFAPGSADDLLDEPLVDTSGVFRAVDQYGRAARRGTDDDDTKRWPDPSLVMRAQGLTDDD